MAGVAIGALVLVVGWVAGVPALTTFGRQQPPMMPNTCVVMMLLGVAAALRNRRDASRTQRLGSFVAAAIALAVGLLTLAEYAFAFSVRIDHLVYPAQVGLFPGRPSPPTVFSVIMLATAILIYDTRPAARVRPAEALALLAGLTAFFGLVGHVFDAPPLYRFGTRVVLGMSLPTSLAVLAITVGMLLQRPDLGVMHLATAPGPAGVLIRRLILPTVVAPAVIGFITLTVLRALDADVRVIVALFVAGVSLLGLIMLPLTTAPLERAHQALTAERARARDLFEQASEAILVADLDARFTELNAAASKLLAMPARDILGKSIFDFTPEDEHTRLRAVREELLRGATHVGRWHVRRADGTIVPIEVSAKILPDGRWQSLVRDMSEQDALEREVRVLADHQQLLAELGALLTESLDRTRIVESAAQLIVRRLADVCVVELAAIPGHADVLRHVAYAGARDLAPASQLTVALHARGAELGQLTIVSCRDTRVFDENDRRRLEEVAQRLASALDNAGLFELATKAVAMRDEVLSVVAHDLRNPLAAAGLGAGLLVRPTNERRLASRRLAARIQRSLGRAQRLIDDLLDITRLEAGRGLPIDTKPVAPAALAVAVADMLDEVATRASIELEADVDPDLPDVLADEPRIVQALGNLVANALKFTPAGGVVRITAGTRGDQVELAVSDTGPGIPRDQLEHLFDRFWQANHRDRRGAGLGLPITKGIVEAHGGQIWVDSEVGRGTTFHITIPIAAGAEQRAAAAAH